MEPTDQHFNEELAELEYKKPTDQRYIHEIRDQAEENRRALLKQCRPVLFDSADEAKFQIGQFLNKAMRKLGVHMDHIPPGKRKSFSKHEVKMMEKRVTRQMKQNDVELHFKRSDDIPYTEHGFYIYHHKEIAYFISEPMIATSKSPLFLPTAIIQGHRQLFLMTNVPKD